MRLYYLFIIKNNKYSIYKQKPKKLYNILKKLSLISKEEIKYELNIYFDLCMIINTKLLINYLKKKKHIVQINKNLFKIKEEETYIQIKYSSIIVKTNKNISNIFKIFNIYSRKIFVCDFIMDDYFWLNDLVRCHFK